MDRTSNNNYWRDLLKGQLSSSDFVQDYSDRAEQQIADFKELEFDLLSQVSENIRQISNGSHYMMYVILLSGVSALLSKYNASEEVTVGIFPILQNGNTDCINSILPLMCGVEKEMQLKELLNEVKEKVTNAVKYQNFPLGVSKNKDGQIEIKVVVGLENLQGQKSFKGIKHQLFFYFIQKEDKLLLKLSYDANLYKEESIEKYIKHLSILFEQWFHDRNKPLSSINLISEEEYLQITQVFNNTEADYPKEKIVSWLFEEQVEKRKDAPAVFFDGKCLSYQELNEKVNQLAGKLRSLGIGPNKFVPIIIERCFEMMIGIYGILKAGAAYVPIDPRYPQERINYILEDCNAEVVLVGKPIEITGMTKVLNLFEPSNYIGSGENLTHVNTPNDLAYVIYTSGTTGRPKGVMINHGALMNRLHWMQKSYPIGTRDVILQKTTYAFDVSVWEIFWWSMTGAAVSMLKQGAESNPEEICETIHKTKVTTIHFVPSMLDVFLDMCGNNYSKTCEIVSLKQVFASGEALKPQTANRFNEYLRLTNNTRLINLYGPTEATIDVTYFNCDEKTSYSKIPIGKPIDNIKIYIINEQKELLPIGIPGELCITGVGVAAGYLNSELLNQEKFINNPFGLGKMYRTGDLARWLDDGNIEYLGRMDEQVKIRGLRIELGEIDNVIRKCSGIVNSAVIAKTDFTGDKCICAYIVANVEINLERLKNEMRKYLPEYMIPVHMLQIQEISVTSNGKLDKKSLPQIETKNVEEYIAPRNDIEQQLCEIYKELLNVTQVGICDNFFSLGGHSLKATQLILKIYAEFQVDVKLADFLNMTSIEELAQYIKSKNQKRLYVKPITPVENRLFYPVSSAQKRQLILSSIDGIGTSYNMPKALRVKGILNEVKLKKVFNQLVERHEAFRTSFETIDGNYVQKIQEHVELVIPVENIIENEIEETIRKFIRPFDLSKAPLLRISIARLSDQDSILLIDMNHIISDGVSVNILIRDFKQLYGGNKLDKLKIQYKDYAVWQQEFYQSEQMKQQEIYWMNQFKDEVPVLDLPIDYKRPTFLSFEGNEIHISLGKDIKIQVQEIANQYHVTQYMVYLTAFYIVLWKYTKQDKIVIGCPIAGRNHIGLENIMGMFLNTLCIKNSINGAQSIEEFMKQTGQICLKAYENQDYPFEELVNKLKLVRDVGRNPLFDVLFLLQNQGEDQVATLENTFTSINIKEQTSKLDLSLVGFEENDEINFKFQYSTKLFQKETIERIANSFIQVLKVIVQNPNCKLKEINVISREDESFIRDKYNASFEKYEQNLLLQTMFERQVKKTPDCTALIFEERYLTYAELNEKSNQVAHYLREQGICRRDTVGIIGTRCFETIIHILGVLKAGAAYVPISEDAPVKRREDILKQSGCKLLLERDFYRTNQIVQYSKDNLKSVNSADDLAYIIYTSGSTGRPKGVAISHKAVVNTLQDINTKFCVNETDCVLGISSMCFDLSVYDLFGTLSVGASLVLIHDQRDALEMKECLIRHKPTIWNSVPAIMNMQVESLDENTILNNLRLVMLSGDWIPLSLPDLITKHFPMAEQVSLGGATEASIWSIYYPIKSVSINWKSIPYGFPLGNQKYYCLDESLYLCPIGVPGELYIGGVGLADGYFNEEEKTKGAFIHTEQFGRLYKTGDFGVLRPEGYIEFLGRQDNQVKIKGYRIELGEIEALLHQHPNVIKACVSDFRDENNKQHLCAYIVPQTKDCNIELQDFLAQYFPDYMIPGYFVEVEQIPLSSNGKVDRKALPMPNQQKKGNKKFELPANIIEQGILDICSQMLNNDHISTKESLFQIGMDSVGLTLLVVKIFKKYKIQIPLQKIFQAPTIASISKYIECSQNVNDFYQLNNVILLKKGKQHYKNLFLIHAVSGEVEPYVELCNFIGSEFQCYGIRAEKGLLKSSEVPTLQEVATAYTEEILSIQNDGNYYIAGWSIGGTIAFEISKQLERKGKKVAFLGMIDTPAPTDKKMGLIENPMKNYGERIEMLYRKNQIDAVSKLLEDNIATNLNAMYGEIKHLTFHQLREKITLIVNLINIRNKYTPEEVIHTSVTFFKAMDSLTKESENWARFLTTPINLRQIQGEHYSLFHPEVIKKWGSLFNQSLSVVLEGD